MQWCASSWRNDVRDWGALEETIAYGKRKQINLYHMPYRTSDQRITRRMLAIRGSSKSADLIYTAAVRPNMPEAQILREFASAEGYPLHSERPLDEPLAWDAYVAYDRSHLERLGERHHKKVA